MNEILIVLVILFLSLVTLTQLSQHQTSHPTHPFLEENFIKLAHFRKIKLLHTLF